MSDPLKENEPLEAELISAACEVFDHMRRMGSILPRSIMDKHLGPRFRRTLLLARIAEAERCEAYGQIGSPRVMELKATLNAVELQIARLGAK